MILVDAGPLVACTDPAAPEYGPVSRALTDPLESYATTMAVLTEAFYLARKWRGFAGQQAIWKLIHPAQIRLIDFTDEELPRARELMMRYRDRPMDFADATLVTVAEQYGIRRIVTLDSDFYIYRIHDREAFDVINPSV